MTYTYGLVQLYSIARIDCAIIHYGSSNRVSHCAAVLTFLAFT